MMTVTPLYAIKIEPCPGGDNPSRAAAAEKRAAEMVRRYRGVMHRNVLSSQDIGQKAGVSKPLVGLRKLEARGHVRVHHIDKSHPGRKQLFWEWVDRPTGAGA
jgi:hypothetical protein